MIDPGGDADKINAALKQHNLSLAAIWLTHGHLDHVGAAHNLREQHKIKMIGPHEDERFWFDNLPMQATMFGFKPINSFYPDECANAQARVSLAMKTGKPVALYISGPRARFSTL